MTRQLQEALARPFSGVKPASLAKANAKAEERQLARPTIEAAPQSERAPAFIVKPRIHDDDLPPAHTRQAETTSAEDDPKAMNVGATLETMRAETSGSAQNLQDFLAAAQLADDEVQSEAVIGPEPFEEMLAEPGRYEAQRREKPSPEAAPAADPDHQAEPSAPTDASGAGPGPEQKDALENESVLVEAARKPAAASTKEPEAVDPQPPAMAVSLPVAGAAKPPAEQAGGQPAVPASPVAAQPAADLTSDPFSVDAIEAEFARLLNRSAGPKP